MTYLLFALEVIALTCILFVTALGIWKAMGWFIATLPEEPMEQPKRIEDVTLVEEDYCGCTTKPLVRIAELGFRFQACGHATYEWSDRKGQCLQCVVEGRIAAKDLGKLRP
jgi:hypothetical protein